LDISHVIPNRTLRFISHGIRGVKRVFGIKHSGNARLTRHSDIACIEKT
jgi:hypothetical protein